MVEVERNPLAVRQGAAAVACIAAAAVAMPVIAHRAAEQRDSAEWAARSPNFYAEQQRILNGDPTARVELATLRLGDGYRSRGQASLYSNGADTHALLVQAALRGPLAPTPDSSLQAQQINPRDLHCLSEAVYYEARGETYPGQVAVAEVVMNRVRSGLYPASICGVVYQGSDRDIGCQFTFTCDGSLDRRPRGGAWERAQHVAVQVMMGYARPITHSATHYHTVAVNPLWSSGLVETAQIGSHVFYRFPNSAERPEYMAALMHRRAEMAARRVLIPPADEAATQAEVAAEAGDADPAAAAATTTPAPAVTPSPTNVAQPAASAPISTAAHPSDVAT
ncbi:MAG: cell wall hydrolase [Terricaulis silvestris]